jgi:predicted DNA binding CopG/RHH family protein
MKQTNKPTLSAEEKQTLTNIEVGEFKSVLKLKQEVVRHAQIAKNTLAKNKTISIRISAVDLMKLKAKAAQEGMPYQTLIASSLHRITA